MDGLVLKKYLDIIIYNIKYHISIRFLFALFIIFFTPIFFSLNDLDYLASSYPLEYFISTIGIVMLTPIFETEIKSNSKEVLEGKYLNYTIVYVIRLLISILLMLGLIMCIVCYMIYNNCDISFLKYTIGTFSTSIFFGSLGFFILGISNNIVISYMIPFVYYIINIACGPNMLGKFYIMTLITGGNNKLIILLISFSIILLTIIIRIIHKKIR